MILYALTIFLSAFLLFQVQPIIAKMILPWFGGGAAVWAACLLFFQCVLLLGYGYSHGIVGRLKPKQQWMLHSAFLALCLLFLPIVPSAAWKPADPSAPVFHILGLLAVTVGLPYFLLSTTGPLIQAWFVRVKPGSTPYRLYALSNLGSMLALLSYPVLIEPTFTLKHQAVIWSVGFVAFALLCAWAGWKSQSAVNPPNPPAQTQATEETVEAPPSWGLRLFWVALAACPSMLLLALTGHMTMDVAPMPFLWIVPLAIYLLSFILCFDASKWYVRKVYLALLPVALAVITWLSHTNQPNVVMPVAVFSLSFFVCCMVCHGELARLKPHPRYLTGFYMMLSVGGAIGGIFVALIAPTIFNAYYELPISVCLCAVLAIVVLFREEGWVFRRDPTGWPAVAVFLFVALLAGEVGRIMTYAVVDCVFAGRNFYGGLTVRESGSEYDWGGHRSLTHGSINHGEQYIHKARRKQPITYYCPDTGAGRYLASQMVGSPQRVALIGLGAGTLAAYGRPGDFYRFYEINPMVPTIAHTYFTYLKDSGAVVDIRMGDARLSLERQEPQNYDFMAVDAFSSDSIPVHLLTREALELYFKHLKPAGMLAVHISNRYINLEPVLERGAAALGKTARVFTTEANKDRTCHNAIWMLLASDPAIFQHAALKLGVQPTPAPWLQAWTDDFSNVYKVLR